MAPGIILCDRTGGTGNGRPLNPVASQTSTSVFSVRPGCLKAWRHHPDDCVQVTIEAHFPADDVRIRTVIAAPKAVADNHRLEESLGSILLRVDAAKLLLHSQQCEIVGACDEAFGADRPISAADRRITRRHSRNFLKHAGALLQIPNLRCGQAYILFVRATKVVEDAHELFGMRKWQGAQQDGVDHAESCNIGANPERERQHRNNCEPGALEQHSERIAQVLDE